MKNNNFFLFLALSIGFSSPISLNATQQPMGWSDWAWQKAAAAQSYAASWVPQSVKDTINGWSMPKKETVLKAILVSLVAAGIYSQKDTIGDILSGAADKLKQPTDYSEAVFLGILGTEFLYKEYKRIYNKQYKRTENLIQPDKTFNFDEFNKLMVFTFCRYGISGLKQLRTIIEDLYKKNKLLPLPKNTIAINNAIANYQAQPFTCEQFQAAMDPKSKGG